MTPTTPPSPTVGDVITVPRPHVPYGPVGVPEATADADYLRSAARNIEYQGRGERLFGSNLTATVVKLLNDAAEALSRPDAPPAAPNVPALSRAGVDRETLTRVIASAVYGDPADLSRATKAADAVLALLAAQSPPAPVDADVVERAARAIARLESYEADWRVWVNHARAALAAARAGGIEHGEEGEADQRTAIMEALKVADTQDYEFPEGYADAIERALARRAGGGGVTEWGVRQDGGFIGRGQIIPCHDEAEARASVECWTPVTREVTAWREVPR